MNISKIPTGANLPQEFNVIIEIPANGPPIKFEQDKESGALFVDRFLATSMVYPLNYGYIPHTLSEDGDPTDALVYTPFPVPPGSVISCRAIGVLLMADEHGPDKKVLAVPLDKICQMTSSIQKIEDLPALLLHQTVHFFEHYKDLEPDKWAKVQGWGSQLNAHEEILSSVARYQQQVGR